MTLTVRPRSAKADSLPHAPPFSDVDFRRLAEIAHREFGLFLQDNKKQVVHTRLLRLLQETGCPDIASFLSRIEADPNTPEREALISALTTNVTSFFRESHHFDLLAEMLLKPNLARLRSGQRLRIWSAGCSAGQEPCSIAMKILELLPEASRLNIRILATDIDSSIIIKARTAKYPDDERRSIPKHLLSNFVRQDADNKFNIDQKVTEMIRFAELNLVGHWPMKGPFDAIFCRNVAIYFDKPTQARLWSRFSQLLRPGGMLFIGHSERVSGPAVKDLVSAGITSYRRIAN
ncbi:protein-glutamate O-methyltransferase CheR [Xinfangfangia sp. D13-10-4-6]|uniref:CheR family methyltransferase n=1 Tax=Pseudogemmobacter hezensis TaxID=2737662 RepID=UPI001552ACD7|nr:protein-glutamate O-methyltransferase CheR [Pseudogemmobacter hezensis]NPD16186.1 protein-glutamate O-methyltransferase CheR [Pseudogemmobacter hezensis]